MVRKLRSGVVVGFEAIRVTVYAVALVCLVGFTILCVSIGGNPAHKTPVSAPAVSDKS